MLRLSPRVSRSTNESVGEELDRFEVLDVVEGSVVASGSVVDVALSPPETDGTGSAAPSES